MLAAMEPDHRKLSRLWITVHEKNGLQGGDRIVIRASNAPENHDETQTNARTRATGSRLALSVGVG